MHIVHSDAVFRVPPGEAPNYNRGNSLLKLVGLVERTRLAAGRELYLAEHLQYLVPIRQLELYGPQGVQADVLDPRQQDDKTDFQKQNVKDFATADTRLVRGWVAGDGWTVPFLRLSYRGGPTTPLSQAAGHALGDAIQLWLRVGFVETPELIRVPYNPETDDYEVELWGDPGRPLRPELDTRGQLALDRGELQVRGDLLRGRLADFDRDGLDDKYLAEHAVDCTMHPILPLGVEVAWADSAGENWDSRDGANYRYVFRMIQRGFEHYLAAGVSPNPHGGIGSLEFRNLLSNYGRYAGSGELARQLPEWSFDAHGRKGPGERRENFLAVDYMDLHVLQPNCGIGLHRHRDNQEVFLMLEGRGLMVIGDWLQPSDRERCFEVRTLRPGELAMLKGGQLHGLLNLTDENAVLFMFGGYD